MMSLKYTFYLNYIPQHLSPQSPSPPPFYPFRRKGERRGGERLAPHLSLHSPAPDKMEHEGENTQENRLDCKEYHFHMALELLIKAVSRLWQR